jgi:glucose-6-phosphate-specific signal transduction histidine kinase
MNTNTLIELSRLIGLIVGIDVIFISLSYLFKDKVPTLVTKIGQYEPTLNWKGMLIVLAVEIIFIVLWLKYVLKVSASKFANFMYDSNFFLYLK